MAMKTAVTSFIILKLPVDLVKQQVPRLPHPNLLLQALEDEAAIQEHKLGSTFILLQVMDELCQD